MSFSSYPDSGNYPVDVPTTRNHIMDGIANADVSETEVTPEMIEAGTGPLLRYHRERSDEADVVREIFERMISVRD